MKACTVWNCKHIDEWEENGEIFSDCRVRNLSDIEEEITEQCIEFTRNGIDMEPIIDAILDERKRQDDLWGKEFDDINTPNDWVAYITRYVSDGAYNGKDNKFDINHFRKRLVQSAALCVAAIESIDRKVG